MKNKFTLNNKAQQILDKGGADYLDEVEDADLIEFASQITNDDGFWYGLTKGGYINFDSIVADAEQVQELNDARDLIEEFEDLYETISFEV